MATLPFSSILFYASIVLVLHPSFSPQPLNPQCHDNRLRFSRPLSASSFSLNTLTAQAGSLSQKKSLGIDKGGETAPAMDSQSLGVAHAMAAPKPPAVVNSVDKTTVSKASQRGESRGRRTTTGNFTACSGR